MTIRENCRTEMGFPWKNSMHSVYDMVLHLSIPFCYMPARLKDFSNATCVRANFTPLFFFCNFSHKISSFFTNFTKAFLPPFPSSSRFLDLQRISPLLSLPPPSSPESVLVCSPNISLFRCVITCIQKSCRSSHTRVRMYSSHHQHDKCSGPSKSNNTHSSVSIIQLATPPFLTHFSLSSSSSRFFLLFLQISQEACLWSLVRN